MSEHDFAAVTAPGEVEADLLVIGCVEGGEVPLAGLPEPVRRATEALSRRSGFSGREKQYVETSVGSGAVSAVSLKGLGKADELDARGLSSWIGSVADRAQANAVDHLALRLPLHRESRGEDAALRVTRTACLTEYRFERYLTDPRSRKHPLKRFRVVPPPGEEAAYETALPLARAMASGAALTRDLANTPSNVAHPEWMESQARELAEAGGFAVTVLGRTELEERGMGGILAVGGGSHREPRLVRLDWGQEGPVVSLVGKGVTFDSGGISIKPSADMDEMKYDKSGACTVLGIARAVAELELPVRLRVFVPLAENMPDGAAYRPGDIVRCYNGKTVEIINTDAEGRMILADALAWAVEEGTDLLVEYSTLTGAAVVALGEGAAGLYSPDDELATELLASAAANGERLWRMPLWPEFVEQMKATHADLKNAGPRWGGANTAAAFLSQFVNDHPHWAHLDIAGPAYVGNHADQPKGATGYGVAATVHWLWRRTG